MKNIFWWQKPKPVLPVAGRPESDENFVPARGEAATEIDKMSLGPAVVPGG